MIVLSTAPQIIALTFDRSMSARRAKESSWKQSGSRRSMIHISHVIPIVASVVKATRFPQYENPHDRMAEFIDFVPRHFPVSQFQYLSELSAAGPRNELATRPVDIQAPDGTAMTRVRSRHSPLLMEYQTLHNRSFKEENKRSPSRLYRI